MYRIHHLVLAERAGFGQQLRVALGDNIADPERPESFEATFDGPTLATYRNLPDPPAFDGERMPGWEAALKFLSPDVTFDPPLDLKTLDPARMLEEAQDRAVL